MSVVRFLANPNTNTGPTSVGLHEVCSEVTDRSSWSHGVARFFDYWLSIAPPGRLPGRQHLDPLDIPGLLSRVWMLDVLRAPLRYRYRLSGTKLIDILGREVTGQFFDEAHAPSEDRRLSLERFDQIATDGVATHRRGPVRLLHRKEYLSVESCMLPFARDGVTVDMIGSFSAHFTMDGKLV